ncbi:hypothetical protein KPH14_010450 [Odynerus spinipes]|uniref:C2H2-type domain-containing protein n=1 Tax=Odynerus spinipes TaxID=1348599 RepID=A0AAD9VT01_9HYME|nr:hypothetical protein KPH14_010450 [Odynerus spinipes]
MGMPDSFCVICNVNLDVSSCINIFYTSLPHNGELLASFALRVLRPATSNLNSSYICPHCYKLFQMLEQAQWTVKNIRCEILKVYQSGEKKKFVRRMISNSNDCLLHNAQIFEDIQTTKRGIDQTINELKNTADITSATNEPTYVINKSFVQDVSLEQNSQTFNTDIININNIKDIELVDSKETFKEETEVDIKDLENIHSNIKSNSDYNMEYTNDNNVKKHIKTEIHNKVIDLNVKILENGFQNSILTDDSTAECNVIEQETSYNQCKFCTESFNTDDELNVHLLKHNDIQLYQCGKCKEIFTNVLLANTHASKAHTGNQDCVNILPVSYKNEIGHFLNEVSLFSQNNTETSNNIKSNNFEHSEIDKNISEIKENSTCSVENKFNKNNVDTKTKVNLSSASWKSGRISKYSLKPLKYTCPTCGKKWRTSAELKTHIKSHSNVRPYMCEKCGQAYKHKHALEIHIGMHNGINPFQCSFCKKCFTQKGALMRHLPMHTGETPYQCELCGKRFIHHTSYNMHALSHTGKKSYQCHVCDLSLLSTSHLKRHMRVHTGEKPYSCMLCGKRFAERYNLLAHQKIHNTSEVTAKEVGKLPSMCNQCNSLYQKGQTCNKHMKQQCSTDNNITPAIEEVSSYTCSLQSLGQSKSYKLHNKNQQQNLKNINSEDSRTWVEMNQSKLDNTSNETELLLLQDSSLQYDTTSEDVTFDDHKMSLGNRNYNTSLKIIIGSSNVSIPTNNQVIID